MYLIKIFGYIFPLGPSNITRKENNRNEVIELINEGEINRRKTPGLQDYTIDLTLPGTKLPFAYYKNGFKSPTYYVNVLRKIKREKKIVRVVVTRKQGKKNLNRPISFMATIEDFTTTEDAETGIDIEVSINFKLWKKYGTKKVVSKKTSSGKTNHTTTEKRPESTKNTGTTTYTVKKGDSLSTIAKKKLGSEKRHDEIYKLNKTVIENAAKKHGRKTSAKGNYKGWWIYPGTKLKLPKK